MERAFNERRAQVVCYSDGAYPVYAIMIWLDGHRQGLLRGDDGHTVQSPSKQIVIQHCLWVNLRPVERDSGIKPDATDEGQPPLIIHGPSAQEQDAQAEAEHQEDQADQVADTPGLVIART